MAHNVPGVLGQFVHIDGACDAIRDLRKQGHRDLTVYTAAANHEIEEALFQNRHDSEDLLDLYVLRRRTTLSKRMLWRSLEVLKLFSPPADSTGW